MYASDTIAAIATPAGRGGIGIVRVSGPGAPAIADGLFRRRAPRAPWRSHRLYAGTVTDAAGRPLDEGLAVLMRAPRSFTGEDVLELHCHGSPVVLRRVLEGALALGARLATPGEFTRRAFLNGRIDLAQAEAVADLIAARTAAAADVAARQLSGQLSASLGAVREDLRSLLALLEAQIDFADDDVEIDGERARSLLARSRAALAALLDTYARGRLVRDGARAAIVGKPNVGKSSLLNALLGEDRAIVTPVAGTTRDAIEDTLDLDGIPLVLTDTAGLRAGDGADPVERLGMERTRTAMERADLVVVVVDAAAPLDDDDRRVLAAAAGALARVIVMNKIDLPRRLGAADLPAEAVGAARLAEVSALTGAGLDGLRSALRAALLDGRPEDDEGPVLTSARHRDAVLKAREALDRAAEGLAAALPPELVAVDVREALDLVGDLVGHVTSEDVLDEIFATFCIGK